MHQSELAFPFKRYQIQPVWRADRPQKGRYQEFYQCDVDIIGSDALLYEAELIKIYDEAFRRLNIPVIIKVNNRKILQGIAEVVGANEMFQQFTIILDKLDKIGVDGVSKQFSEAGLTNSNINRVFELLKLTDVDSLKAELIDSEIGLKGIEEITTVQQYLSIQDLTNQVNFDWSLARGLNYYTGCIFEVVCPGVSIGSIGGGGRYDDLTSVFGLKGVSGVGVSFGAARIYDVMNELDLFPKALHQRTKVLFVAYDQKSHDYAFSCLTKLRNAGIAAAIYPNPTKMKRQMKYANDRGIPYLCIVGEEELKANALMFKNMETGEQALQTVDQVIEFVN
ncbi:UNVERIFIED_CONTAM: hypothetical protein GTU68_014882 [Idotea baltica]|nr:hypothetical protein [Idotea baltica]